MTTNATRPAISHLSTMAPYTTHAKYRIKRMTRMGKEIRNYIVGPMPPRDFLDEFFPPNRLEGYAKVPFERGSFRDTIKSAKETSAYEPFVNSAADLAPELVFVDSSKHPDSSRRTDFSFDIKPDICVYSKDADALRSGPTDMSRVEITIEFKWKACDDAFSQDPQHAKLLSGSKAGLDTLGQITAYASAQIGSQFRTHCYSVLIVRDIARILRWDRSGVIVTAPIMYDEDEELAEFLHRFSKASSAMRGVDETATVAPEDDSLEARKCFNLDENIPMFQIMVPCLYSPSNIRVIVPAPIATPYSPTGRATRGFVAYDPDTKEKVFLKDSWRVDAEGIEPEGDIYKLLHEKQVRNVPFCIAAGDVSTSLYHATQAQNFVAEKWVCPVSGGTKGAKLSAHRHYRLALETVGAKLTEFESSRELVKSISNALDGEKLTGAECRAGTVLTKALLAHKDAIEKAQILHQDISPGNVIKGKDGGMLIDWDLCKRISDDNQASPRRTGTWQFMSGALIHYEDAQHRVEDDLESFLYTLLWVAIMYSPTNLTPEGRAVFVNQTFNQQSINGFAGTHKISWLKWPGELHRLHFQDGCGNRNRETLRNLFLKLADKLAERYRPEKDWKSATSGTKVTHEELSALFRCALEAEDWPVGDRWCAQNLALCTEDGEESEWRVTKTDWVTDV